MTTNTPDRTPAPAPAPAVNPFYYEDSSSFGPAAYTVDVDELPKVQAEPGTGKGQLTFRTPDGGLAATNISTSERLFAAAANALALAHAVAAYEDAQRDEAAHSTPSAPAAHE